MNKFYQTLTNLRGDVLFGYRAQVVDETGAIVDIYKDRNGTRFTDDSGNIVNYAEASTDTGMAEFYWNAETGQILQIADSSGDLARTPIIGFGDNFVLNNMSGDLPTSAIDGLDADLAAKVDTTALAAPDGGSKVGFTQLGSAAILRTQEEKSRDIFNAKDFGVKADGTTEDAVSLNAAIEELYQEFGGGTLYLPPGDIRTSEPILWRTGVNLIGVGSQRPTGATTRLLNDTSDIIEYGMSGYLGATLSNMEMLSDTGGGHLIKMAGAQSRTNIRNVNLSQRNPDGCILHSVTDALNTYIGNWWENFNAEVHPENTVPAFLIESLNTINQLAFRNFRLGRSAVSSGGSYLMDIHGQSAGVHNGGVLIEQGTFQQPGGGAVKLRGLKDSVIRLCGIYDLTSGSTEPLFYFGVGDGGQGCFRSGMDQVYSNVPSSTDLFVETSTSNDCFIRACDLGTVVGDDPDSSRTALINDGSQVSSYSNINVTSYTSRGLDLRQPNAMITRFQEVLGRTSSFDGYLRWLLNEAYVGGLNSSGDFVWGGSAPSAPNIRMTSAGSLRANEFRDNTTGGKIVWGTGSPEGAVAAFQGSMYLQTDGDASTMLWLKTTNSGNTGWVAK